MLECGDGEYVDLVACAPCVDVLCEDFCPHAEQIVWGSVCERRAMSDVQSS